MILTCYLFLVKVDATKSVVPSTDKLLELKFNISNDQEYELLRKNYNTKQRSQLSNLNIEHSVPHCDYRHLIIKSNLAQMKRDHSIDQCLMSDLVHW